MENKMHLINRIIAMSRAAQLGRQLREVEQSMDNMAQPTRVRLAGLVMREIDQAARCEFPHLYGTPPDLRYKLWGTGTETGIERAKSDNLQVRLRGIALWLAVAYHETRESSFSDSESMHRRIQGIVRKLKENVPADSAGNRAVA